MINFVEQNFRCEEFNNFIKYLKKNISKIIFEEDIYKIFVLNFKAEIYIKKY